jgi:cyclic pyranopterin phosphate synthase
MKKQKLSHYDDAGAVSMVDVSAKAVTSRTATARAYVAMPAEVIAALPQNKKGNPFEIARIAGISAAKKTSELIPLCHQLPLSHLAVEFRLDPTGVEVTATARTIAQTGVEMEAMTAAAVAALTIYDMTKALNKSIEIREIHLLEKTGGKSGTFRRGPAK